MDLPIPSEPISQKVDYSLSYLYINQHQSGPRTIRTQYPQSCTICELLGLIVSADNRISMDARLWLVNIDYTPGINWEAHIGKDEPLKPLAMLTDVLPQPKPSFVNILIYEPPKSPISSAGHQLAGTKRRRATTELQNRYKRVIEKNKKASTPSVAAKSAGYRNFQRSNPIFDGRYNLDSRTSTIGPPIQLYHPVFASFLTDANNNDLDIPDNVLAATAEIMKKSSALYPTETARQLALEENFRDATSCAFAQSSNTDRTTPDSAVMHTLPPPINETVALLFREEKRELAENSDPTIQAGLSMARFWSQDNHKRVRNITCCPTLLLATGGPWLAVLGAVFTDKVVCQHLTDLIWIGFDRVLDEARVHSVARVLHALGRSVDKLRKYYDDVATSFTHIEDLQEPQEPRFFPSINSYNDSAQTRVSFQYVRALEEDPACVTFLAKTPSATNIVVKFVTRYGVEVHRLLAAHGFAPQLFYFGELDTSLSYGNLRMVVMEYLQGQTVAQLNVLPLPTGTLTETWSAALHVIIDLLHKSNFVYGDLRGPNVIVMQEDNTKIKLIDFDWAGKAGTTRYPILLNSSIVWPSGVSPNALITEQHDLDMIMFTLKRPYNC